MRLSEGELFKRLARIVERPAMAAAAPGTGLFDDLNLDSLGTFQLIVSVESLAGCEIPPLDLPEMYTMGAVYSYYVWLVEHVDEYGVVET